MKTSNKGVLSETIAQSYFAKDPNLLIFTPLCGVGPIDIITYNIKTKEYNNYDVKTESFRLSNTKYGNKNKDRINRTPNKRQKNLNVKIVYVNKEGKITIK
jgi:hypothetical protein